MSAVAQLAIDWIEQGLVPDTVIRAGIRRLCERRLRQIAAGDTESAAELTERFVRSMDSAAIACLPLTTAADVGRPMAQPPRARRPG